MAKNTALDQRLDDRGLADGGVDVEQRIAAIAGQLNVQHALLIDAVAEALRSGGWHGERIHTPAQWLTIHAGVSGGSARKLVGIAERVEVPEHDWCVPGRRFVVGAGV